MDRREYYKKYNAERKEWLAGYYKAYNSKPANKRRRRNRYLRDKKKWAMESLIEELLKRLDSHEK